MLNLMPPGRQTPYYGGGGGGGFGGDNYAVNPVYPKSGLQYFSEIWQDEKLAGHLKNDASFFFLNFFLFLACQKCSGH